MPQKYIAKIDVSLFRFHKPSLIGATLNRLLLLLISLSLAACITLPPGSEFSTTFTREIDKPYQEVYRTIAKQMRHCYRTTGLFGNGYDVQSDLETAANQGTIELYNVNFMGIQKPEDSFFSRTVIVKASSSGSTITTKGTTPKIVYKTHMTIPVWLEGDNSCAPRLN